MLPHADVTMATMAAALWDTWWERRRAEGTECPGPFSGRGIGHWWMAGGAVEGPAALQRERGWWERVSSDLSRAGRKEGRKWGRLELHRRFLPAAAQCTTGKPGQGCLLPAPSKPSAGRVAVRVPHGDKDVSVVQQDLLAVAGGTTVPRSRASRSPSETGTGQGTQAVHCAGGLAGGLKITRCECLEGLGPRPWPHTIGGNPPASSIV